MNKTKESIVKKLIELKEKAEYAPMMIGLFNRDSVRKKLKKLKILKEQFFVKKGQPLPHHDSNKKLKLKYRKATAHVMKPYSELYTDDHPYGYKKDVTSDKTANKHIDSLNFYAGHGHEDINSGLYKRNSVPRNCKRHAENLKQMYHRANPLPEDMHVFSGIKYSPEGVAKKHQGVLKIVNPAFTSTSISKRIARCFGSNINEMGVGKERNKRFPIHSTYMFNHKKVRVDADELKRHRDKTNKLENQMSEFLRNSDYTWSAPGKRTFYKPKDRVKHKQLSDEIKNHEKEGRQKFGNIHGIKTYDHMLRIHVPKGSRVIANHEDLGLSNNEEKEVILHPGSKIHVHPVPEIDHVSRAVIHHAKLVHDGIKPTRHMKK